MKNFILILLLVFLQNQYQGQNRRSTSSSSTTRVEKKTTPTPTTSSEKVSTEKSTTPSSGSAFLTPASELQKMSTTIEFGGYPSDADVSFINFYGHLGLNFDLNRRFFIGPYFRYKILSSMEYQVMNIDGRDLDISSFNEWGTGLSIGTYLPAGKKLLFTPEFRLGYNEYNIQTDTFNKTNKAFLNHKFINFTPRLNIGYKISDYTILNISAGYILPYYLGDGQSTIAYNPSTFTYGLGLRFYLIR